MQGDQHGDGGMQGAVEIKRKAQGQIGMDGGITQQGHAQDAEQRGDAGEAGSPDQKGKGRLAGSIARPRPMRQQRGAKGT